jgi:hypothetical protein
MNVAIFWDIESCILYVNQPPAARWFLAWLNFHPEEGSYKFLRNVSEDGNTQTI